MYYFDYVRARGSLTIFAYVLGGLVAFALASIPFSHVGHGETTIGISGAAVRLHDYGGYRLLHQLGQSIHIPFVVLTTIAACVGIVYGTTFATSLSRVNGNLHLWFTRPVSRERTALVTIAVDAVTIAIGLCLALVAVLIPIAATGLLDRIRFDGDAWLSIAAGLSVAYMWYALLQVATAGLRSKAGVILGLSWPIFAALRVLDRKAGGFLPDVVTDLVHALNFINPLRYLGLWMFGDGAGNGPASIAWSDVGIVWLTIVVSLAVAVAIRKRMEA